MNSEVLEILRKKFFLSPDGSNVEVLEILVKEILSSCIESQGSSCIYPITKKQNINNLIRSAEIPFHIANDFSNISSNLPFHLQGCIKPNHPFMVKNLIPLPSFIYLAIKMAVSLYMPNGVTGEDSANVLHAEIACASALAKLAGLNPYKAAGVFTFGGTGTNLYGLKIGLCKASPQHNTKGIKENIIIVGSKSSHYSHKTCANWLGIGTENYLQVPSNLDQTTNLSELENVCSQAIENDKIIACIEAVGGTTSNMGIDNFKEIYNIRKRLIKKYRINYIPHIHADTVISWAYLNFHEYDFDENKLNFSAEVILRIEEITRLLKNLQYVDSFGVDFHKTGYMPYVSSMIICKNRHDIERLRGEISSMTPLFHDGRAYNPGTFTLETSRDAANILATWLTLQSFGKEGYQTLLGHSLEISIRIRNEFFKHKKIGILVVNKSPFGCDIFIRVYPPSTSMKEIFTIEVKDRKTLEMNNMYLNSFSKWVLDESIQFKYSISISKSSAAFYTSEGIPVPALRIYPLNPYITYKDVKILVNKIVNLKTLFDDKRKSESPINSAKNS